MNYNVLHVEKVVWDEYNFVIRQRKSWNIVVHHHRYNILANFLSDHFCDFS